MAPMDEAVAKAPAFKPIESASPAVLKGCEDTARYAATIEAGLGSTMGESAVTKDALDFSKKTVGKVRDIYDLGDHVALVATDRQSAFDRNLASVPFKGTVLNLCSKFWFELLEREVHVKNAVVAYPDPNVTVARKCEVFPVEFVMRRYLTGSTSTSIWKNYAAGKRDYCGHRLPDGLVRNQVLPMGDLLTPTTKDDAHDELISEKEIVESGRMTQADWDQCKAKAHAIFAKGREVAARRGLILVDTKYEFGKDPATGEILLIDEVHTPDSSRWWVADTYEARFAAGQEPEMIDKEFLRLWFTANCDPYKDAVLPAAPKALVCELSRRYIMIFELLTGSPFSFPAPGGVNGRIQAAMAEWQAQRAKGTKRPAEAAPAAPEKKPAL